MSTKTTGASAKGHQTIVVCGSLHFDVVVDAPHLPAIDETVRGSSVNYICGGKGGNQAVAAALNGAPTAFVGCIGDDESGKQLLTHLQQHNIDCSGLQKINGASGMSVAIVDDNGDYGAVIVSASNLDINSDAIEFPVSMGMLVLQNEIDESTNITLAQQARAAGIPVMLNAAPYRSLPNELVNSIDILVLNRVEASAFLNAQISGVADCKFALNSTDSCINTIIITLGAEGLVYRGPDNTVHTKPAYSVSVISSHGAGDMFCGALASSLLGDASLDQALDYAMAAAAWHVSTAILHRSNLDTKAIYRLMQETT
jgi:ribokinase